MNWREQIEDIEKKANKKAGLLKWMTNKLHLKQDFALNLYKACIRPTIEYGSEIWDDACKSVKGKLEVIEHKALTTALGTTRLAKRTETKLEALIMPLELRRQKRTLNVFLKYEGLPEIKRIRSDKKNHLQSKTRVAFFKDHAKY